MYSDKYQCKSKVFHQIVVEESFLLEMPQDTSIRRGEQILLIPNVYPNIEDNSSLIIDWTPSGTLSDPNSLITYAFPTDTTTYELVIVSQELCKAIGEVTVFVTPDSINIVMPTAFSPNDDPWNDVLKPEIQYKENLVAATFEVYNRWGEKVYKETIQNW